MNTSEIKEAVRRALSKDGSGTPNSALDREIEGCLAELQSEAAFRFLSAYYREPPAFLQAAPYAAFLSEARGCFLVACTLGAALDRRLHRLSLTAPARMTLLDASANAYLEQLAKERIATLNEQVSYLFCPGYAGSDVRDLHHIFTLLKPERIGMTITQGGLMLPQKSMAGIVAVGGDPKASCEGCVRRSACTLRKEGKTCN